MEPRVPVLIALQLPRWVKRVVALAVDIFICVLTVWLSLYLRLGEFVTLSGVRAIVTLVSIGIAVPLFAILGLYRAIFRYSGFPAMLAVTRAIGIYGLIFMSIFTLIGINGVPRTVGIIQPLLLLLFVGGSRALARFWLGDQYVNILKRNNRPKVLIYGAGHAGDQLANAIRHSPEMQVVGFLDDDKRLQGSYINGYRIYDPEDLQRIVRDMNINDILLAMPSVGRRRRNEILQNISVVNVSVRTLPSLTDLAQGKVSLSDLQPLDVDDLLGRESVAPDLNLLHKNVFNKIIVVTGSGGSIGSELCRQILAIGPRKLLLLEQSEFALYRLHQELIETREDCINQLVPLLASVQDYDRIKEILSIWKPDTVYHTAAYKHVPLVEHNSVEGIKNNVFGTLNMALASVESDVSDFVLISTDKAVRPTNIMGATKRLAEMVLQALSKERSSVNFSIVRFGNVLDSSGSVVPRFRDQIRVGGPITVTHPEITRFFMTIPEAAQLVIQAGAMAVGGDVFVLDMGAPIKITTLARRIVELSGLSVRDEQNPGGDISIEYTGLRPGEKLFEELVIGKELLATSHPRIMKANEDFLIWEELKSALDELETVLKTKNPTHIRDFMKRIVDGYRPLTEIVDWTYLNRSTGGRSF